MTPQPQANPAPERLARRRRLISNETVSICRCYIQRDEHAAPGCIRTLCFCENTGVLLVNLPVIGLVSKRNDPSDNTIYS